MITRYFYCDTIQNFLVETKKSIIGTISMSDEMDSAKTQKNAWETEIDDMKSVLAPYITENGKVIFEYTIPRLGKRIDVVVLLRGIIFVIEYKTDATAYTAAALDQVMDYALDLKNFHLESHNRYIVPILVATNATTKFDDIKFSHYDDKIFNPFCVSSSDIQNVFDNIFGSLNLDSSVQSGFDNWENSRYMPTPTIIEAASALYHNHSVEDITKTEAEGASLKTTTDFVLDVIAKSKQNNEKSICFVTGVPGAGKTLVGLNVAIQQSDTDDKNNRNLAVYLSGNGPLVKVLTAALAKDKKARATAANQRCNITDARREVSQFIQIIHRYRDNMLAKIKKPIKNGALEIDPTKSQELGKSGHGEVEHVAIFDEAQRAWTKEHLASWLARGGSRGVKTKIADFPMSEAEFLIWSLDLRKDWAVIVCLVGGGQEINTGEAGIGEWVKACNTSFPDWKVYISPHLVEKEYAEGNLTEILKENKNVTYAESLHLGVSMRSFRAEKLSDFVHALLDLDVDKARRLYSEFCDKYPLVLTRDIEEAKRWLISRARGSERYGMVVSSQAYRLRPMAIDVRFQPDVEHWFLADKTDVRSSLFLEDVATEFDVQGLELDWTCLVWDGDFRLTSNGWRSHAFKGSKWQRINKPELRSYQLNAYRVLLTRARQGMVICVPHGEQNDITRQPEFYDGTYEYLRSIGIKEL